MSTEYSAFARPNFTAADFEREEVTSDTPMFAEPIYARQSARRSSGGSRAAWVAIPVLALAVGAGAYMLSQPSHNTVAATPMAPRTAMTAPVPATPAPAPETAQVTTPDTSMAPRMAPEAPVRTAQATPTRRAPARTAPRATTAETSGVDASATVPSAPVPYSGSAQTSAPAPMVMTPPPATTAVNPAPAAAAPAVTPEPSPPADTTTPPDTSVPQS